MPPNPSLPPTAASGVQNRCVSLTREDALGKLGFTLMVHLDMESSRGRLLAKLTFVPDNGHRQFA
jgi:hypothetical protein